MQISLKQIQTQKLTSDFSINGIERESIALYSIKDLLIPTMTKKALKK